jgi:large subunit ribosomal protein L9
MEVLLLDDIVGVGKKNDLIIVKDGYALNYLLPHRRALVATPKVRQRYAEDIARRAQEREQEKAAKADVAQALKDKSVTLMRKATKTGKLYAAITEKIIADAIKESLGLDIESSAIEIAEPIKALGDHSVTVSMGEAKGPLLISVEKEE